MSYLLVGLFAYLFGSVPFGLLIGLLYGKDIRKEGSGNIGATNVTRVIGKGAGRLCFLLDLLKGALPVLLAGHLGIEYDSGLGMLIAGAAAILGHMFPVYLKFKGGKGISTAAGVAAAMAPAALLAAGVIWLAVFWISRYVSLASILAAIALPVIGTILYFCGRGLSGYIVVFFYLVGALAVYKHRGNIVRLRDGTEMRFGKKNKEDTL